MSDFTLSHVKPTSLDRSHSIPTIQDMNIHSSEVHPIQGRILRELLYHPERKFSEMKLPKMPSDQFSFHLRRLIELAFIKKIESGYELTAAGKEFANRFDSDTPKMVMERQAKIGVLVVAVRNSNGTMEYLAQQRLKQPYFGFHGFMTGKIKWGEAVAETAARELEEETGLRGECTLVAIKHKMDYSSDGTLLEDKYFYVFRVDNAGGNLIERFEGGRNVWLSEEEILKLPDLFDGVQETIEVVNKARLRFIERKYIVQKY